MLGLIHTKLIKKTETNVKLLSTHTHTHISEKTQTFLDDSVFCPVHIHRTAAVNKYKMWSLKENKEKDKNI
jgi:hypothetical protein